MKRWDDAVRAEAHPARQGTIFFKVLAWINRDRKSTSHSKSGKDKSGAKKTCELFTFCDCFKKIGTNRSLGTSYFFWSFTMLNSDYVPLADKAVSMDIACETCGRSRAAIYEAINPNSPRYEPDFPRPFKVGKRATRFSFRALQMWLEIKANSKS